MTLNNCKTPYSIGKKTDVMAIVIAFYLVQMGQNDIYNNDTRSQTVFDQTTLDSFKISNHRDRNIKVSSEVCT